MGRASGGFDDGVGMVRPLGVVDGGDERPPAVVAGLAPLLGATLAGSLWTTEVGGVDVAVVFGACTGLLTSGVGVTTTTASGPRVGDSLGPGVGSTFPTPGNLRCGTHGARATLAPRRTKYKPTTAATPHPMRRARRRFRPVSSTKTAIEGGTRRSAGSITSRAMP